MAKVILNEETGAEETYFSAAELEAQKAEVANAALEKENALKAEIEKAQKVLVEKTENFRRLNDMTEKEKEQFSTKELEIKRQAELAEDRARALETQYQNDTTARANAAKDAAIAKYAGQNAEIKQKLIDSWDLINLSGTDEATINQKAGLVFNMVTGGTHSPNPLTQGFTGESPTEVAIKEGEKFLGSDKGQAALKAMGFES